MVVQDPKTLSCEIYEIKYSNQRAREQYRHINDEEKMCDDDTSIWQYHRTLCYLSWRKYRNGFYSVLKC